MGLDKGYSVVFNVITKLAPKNRHNIANKPNEIPNALSLIKAE